MTKSKDITGQKFNRLTAIKFHHTKEYTYSNNRKQKTQYWLCKCDCGKITIVSKSSLVCGKVKSCGCLRKEISTQNALANTKHGLKHTKIYSVWHGIKTRCYNINSKDYQNYGGRGIKMCDEWRNDVQAFYYWAINNGHDKNLTIDRIDVNGDYSPNNCRWISRCEQERNKRRTRYLTYNGETHCMKEWAEIIGINYSTLKSRLGVKKWSVERALNEKVMKTEKEKKCTV